MAPPRSGKISCAIPGCDRAWHCRDWCKFHYERWRRHGDPIADARQRPAMDYLRNVVLNHEGRECLAWPFARNRDGYAIIHGGLVSRMVCEAKNGPPPTPDYEAAHSCGKGHEACVNRGHLDWKTHAENMADRLAHGTHNRGERCGKAKLTAADVLKIRKLRDQQTQQEIAGQFGISAQQVSKILSAQQWAHSLGASS